MTIHSDHPFLPPDDERDPVRRFRGRLGGAVSLWTTGAGPDRSGLTVASLMVAAGEPGHVLALVDPESDFAEAVQETRVAVVQLLTWDHRQLADVFAGQFPAPGGAFRLAEWDQTTWGPKLRDVSAWAGVRLIDGAGTAVGWSTLIDAVIEQVDIGDEATPLVHRRGRYLRPESPG
jgi:flavin reductase (DIM6/NTAB) family NADH-FMN oxidoreductase RutF